MSTTRRTLLSSLLGASALGLAQTYQTGGGLAVGLKADNDPQRTECGVGALMPWADALWASHLQLAQENNRHRPRPVSYRRRPQVRTRPCAQWHACQPADSPGDQPVPDRTLHHRRQGQLEVHPEFENHRLTSTMRHLKEPKSKVYYQTMEGLFLEMDLATSEAGQAERSCGGNETSRSAPTSKAATLLSIAWWSLTTASTNMEKLRRTV